MIGQAPVRPADPARQRPFRLKVAAWLRWLHIYLSMFSLMIVLFFSATGITLNHPEWFAEKNPKPTEIEGKVSTEWLAPGSTDEAKVARLEIVEHLRKQNGVRGALDEFRVDDTECMVSFKAPGYSADSFINRETGEYRLTILAEGVPAFLNDLHKGRHSGTVWARFIDLSGIFLVLISLTGMGLIFYLKRLRTAGLLTALAGLLALILMVRFLVP
jgi:hypothetical protein